MTHTQETAICTCEISHFEASGVMIWFNKEDTRFMALRNVPSFLTTQKMAVANIFSAAGLDPLHLWIIPPPGRIIRAVAFQPFQGECKVGTTFRITLTCSLPFHSGPHEHSSFLESCDMQCQCRLNAQAEDQAIFKRYIKGTMPPSQWFSLF